MRVSQLLTRLRDRIDESTANVYSDAQLVRFINEAVDDLFRLQVQHDESWHNCEFDLTFAANGRTLHTDVTLYDIPRWVHKITGIRVTSTSSSGREANIPVRTLHNRHGSFWAPHGFRRIMVAGGKAESDITVSCSKMPAPLNAGTLGTPATLVHSTSQIHFDHGSGTESVYEVALEADWYKNAIFEFTGVNSGSHAIEGLVASGASSATVYDTDDSYTSVTFEAALGVTPAAADTWEMVAEVQSVHVGFLTALAAHKVFIRKSNYEAASALAPDLEREKLRFVESITPRQDQLLPFQGMDADFVMTRDPDRDWEWGGR